MIDPNNITAEDSKYLAGNHNKAIRYYYYIERGLDIINLFRNLFLGIFAAYFALKLDNVWILVAMFVISMPTLAIMGYYNVHKLSKIKEWLNIRFSTHFGIKTFDYTKRQVELMEEIRDLLKKQ